ncbi:MAG: hypothetical protein ACREQH_09150 [Candidatus Binatus sp.]
MTNEHEPEINRLFAEISRRQSEWRELAEPVWESITEDLREAAPDADDLTWPQPEVNEFPDPLFDSQRSYLAQIMRYKRHQGKVS